MKNNFIPCAKWIRRGVAKSSPKVFQLSRQELKGLVDKAKGDILETAKGLNIQKDVGAAPQENKNSDQFCMEDYDKEDDLQSLIGIGNFVSLDEPANSDNELQSEEDEDDSDKEDDKIKPTDNLIAVGHVCGDISVLELYVFNEEDSDLYVHHDIVLPTIPLALESLSYSPAQPIPGNLLAMGGMTPEITLWDLDIVNSLEPLLKLGEFSDKKKYQHRNHGHRDAVLDLSWNKILPHVLASGSVDRSILLWDLEKSRAVSQINDFQEKVQTIEWHPCEVNVLVGGACDSTVRLMDCRIAEMLRVFRVDGEVEKVVWHPANQFTILVGTSTGFMYCADCRVDKFLWKKKAHEKEITGLTAHCDNPDSIITCSTDQTVKLWSLAQEEPILIYTKHTSLGDLQCLQVCPEHPNIVCLGGNKINNNFKVFNLLSEIDPDAENTESDSQEVGVQ